METLERQLEGLRERLFVGRANELSALDALLFGERARVLCVQGMGGIGKTELLRAFARLAREREWEVARIDARDVLPTAEAVGAALLGSGSRDRPHLVLLDSFELLSAVERPLRERVLPALPATWRIVLASRQRLSPAWAADPGWRELLETVELGELSYAEARDYLERKRIDPERIGEVVDLAGGVPLALALASDAVGVTAPGELEDDPNVIEALLPQLIDRAPSPAHHRALAVSALVLHTTEEVLEGAVGGGSVSALFDWLASRPFFHADARGIYPHDLVRHALIRRIKWRRPDLFIELVLAAGEYQVRRLRRQLGTDAAADTAREAQFLLGHGDLSPLMVDGFYRYQAAELRPEDWPVVDEIVTDQAGPEAVGHLHTWRDHPAFEIHAVRRAQGELEGFFSAFQVHRLSPEQAHAIPGVGVFVHHFGPFDRPVPYLWLWGGRQTGQDVSPTQSCAMQWIANQILAHLDAAHSACAVQEGLDWIHTGTVRTSPKPVPECAFELGPARYVVLHKAHVEPPLEWFLDMVDEWLEMLRGAGGTNVSDGAHSRTLSTGQLLHELKQALKQADRPLDLVGSGLFDLTFVAERTAGAPTRLERGRALVELLRELARETFESSRDQVHHRVLVRTYFEPAAKQQAVAAELNLGYSTYRRYLATAVERLAAALLEHEIGARARGGTTGSI